MGLPQRHGSWRTIAADGVTETDMSRSQGVVVCSTRAGGGKWGWDEQWAALLSDLEAQFSGPTKRRQNKEVGMRPMIALVLLIPFLCCALFCRGKRRRKRAPATGWSNPHSTTEAIPLPCSPPQAIRCRWTPSGTASWAGGSRVHHINRTRASCGTFPLPGKCRTCVSPHMRSSHGVLSRRWASTTCIEDRSRTCRPATTETRSPAAWPLPPSQIRPPTPLPVRRISTW
jgi:hypothetical protein